MRHLLIPILAVVLASCSDALDPQSAEIAGVVTRAPSDGERSRMLVSGNYLSHVPAIGAVSDFNVGIRGPVWVQTADGDIVPALPSALRAGVPVRLWTTGVELRSLPPQITAVRILIENR